MDFCEDSPKKKKRKLKNSDTSNLARKCIFHVFKEETGPVSKFSDPSWKVYKVSYEMFVL